MAKIVDWDARIGGRVRLRDLHILLAVDPQFAPLLRPANQLACKTACADQNPAFLRCVS